MASVAVVTDSVACLSPGARAELGVGMVGIHIVLDGEEYRDSLDLDPADYFARMEEFSEHRTAAPSVGEWVQEFERMVGDGAQGLLVVTVAARLSGTYNSARLAADLAPVPTVVIDSKSASAAQHLMVRRLAEEARDGVSLDELAERAERRRDRYHLEFVLSGLDRLARSGRMPAAMARLGDAADVKPMLTLGETGEIRPTGGVRGLRRGVERLYRRALDGIPPGVPARAVVTHALLPDEADDLVGRLVTDRPEAEVDLAVFSPVMGANTGPIVGVGWEDPAVTSGRA